MTSISTDAGPTTAAQEIPWDPRGEVRVVPAEAWDGLVDRLGARDTYTSAAYHAASTLLEPPGTRAVLLHYRDATGEIGLPLLLRPIAGRAEWDATSAYGYGGPFTSGSPDIAAFGAALDTWADDNAVVATFLRPNPLTGNVRAAPPTGEVVRVGHTFAWDISPGRDLRAHLHRNHRRSIRKADAAGVEVTVVPRPRELDRFRDLYAATMRRQQAGDFFFFPQSYWDALLVPDDMFFPVLVEATLDGRVIASLLCLVTDPWVHAHLIGSDDSSRSLGASHRCYLAAAEWAQAQGLTGLHMGGGVGADENSPLYTFKRRFDPDSRPLPFDVVKIVHDQERYRELSGGTSTQGYFPAWRRPR